MGREERDLVNNLRVNEANIYKHHTILSNDILDIFQIFWARTNFTTAYSPKSKAPGFMIGLPLRLNRGDSTYRIFHRGGRDRG